MTELEMETAQIREALNHRARDLAIALLGPPHRAMSSTRQLRFGRKGSLSIEIDGHKRGVFTDHESQQGGDLFKLIQRVRDCDFSTARDFAKDFIGGAILPTPTPSPTRSESRAEPKDNFWAAIWREAGEPRKSIVERYLASRDLPLTDDLANTVLRYHPRLKFEGRISGGMVALFRDIRTNAQCGIHRTFLDAQGSKLDRKFLGRRKGAAIKLDPDENVTMGLHVGEGVETCIAARLVGFRPVWALGCAGGIADFPVRAGIEALTVLGETEDGGANARATATCARRWAEAGCEISIVEPLVGDDLAAVLRAVQ